MYIYKTSKLLINILNCYLKILFVFVLSKLIKLNSKKINDKNNTIICFLYGGIGDQLIIIDRLNVLSERFKIIVYLDNKFKFLKDFLKTKHIKYYSSKKKFGFLFNIFKEKNTNKIYFSNSANFIHLVIYLLGGYVSFIGYLGDFKKVLIGNVIFSIEIKNRYESMRFISEKLIKEKIDLIQLDNNKLNNKILNFSNSNHFAIMNICKTSYWGDVSLPLETWVKFILNNKYLNKMKIILIGDRAQIKKNKKLYNLISSLNVYDLTGKTNFYELAYLISKSKFIICNDSGVMHLSNFFKKKNLAIFTFSDPKFFANYKYTKVIFEEKNKCQPCISLSNVGSDNYPPICFNSYNCAKSINEEILEEEFNSFYEAINNSSL